MRLRRIDPHRPTDVVHEFETLDPVAVGTIVDRAEGARACLARVLHRNENEPCQPWEPPGPCSYVHGG